METQIMLETVFCREKVRQPEQLSALILAQLGDAVYELYIRNKLIAERMGTPHKFHLATVRYVKAGAQAKALAGILPDLTEEEQAIVRRGRNAKACHLPKHASPVDYNQSSAFEALIGYLYLKQQDERLGELLKRTEEILGECETNVKG